MRLNSVVSMHRGGDESAYAYNKRARVVKVARTISVRNSACNGNAP